MFVRKALHARGFRYRLHFAQLPGKPDLVFPKYHAVILVQGCFWHRHRCHLFKWPQTRTEFWKGKINRNADRDIKNIHNLQQMGWRIMEVWECALKGKHRLKPDNVFEFMASWLASDIPYSSIAGEDSGGTYIGERNIGINPT